jgi:surface carbohydrate biosynthesis protein
VKKSILIFVDNPLRDLPANTFLAIFLVSKGFDVYLTPFNNAAYETFRLNPDYVLVNYARISNEVFLRRALDAKLNIGVLDTEGGVFVRMEKEGGKPNVVKTFAQNSTVLTGIKDYFVWGKFLFDYLSDNGPFLTKCLHLTGTPRTDMLYYSATIHNHKKDLILLNTSFPLVNPKFSTPENEARVLISKFKYDAEAIMEEVRQQTFLLKRFIETSKNLAACFPNERFVLRPHPFEKIEVYRDALRNRPNIEVSSENTIDYWLARSKALFHFQCSTAIEAALVEVPAFSMRADAHLRSIEAVEKLTDFCDTEEELFTKVGNVLNGKYSKSASLIQNREEVIRDIYFRFDGKASERICEKLVATLKNSEKSNSVKRLFWYAFYGLKNIAKRILGRDLVRKEKRFSVDDVEDLLGKIKNIPTLNDMSFDVSLTNDSVRVCRHLS